MARFSVTGRTSIVGTTTLPNVSLFATAAVAPKIREVHLFNTSSTGSFDVQLTRFSALGTAGAGLTEVAFNPVQYPTAICTAFAGHTVAPTIAGAVISKTMAAAVGDGVIWTFPDGEGLTCALGTGNGYGILVPSGVGQTLNYTIIWDE